jgi:flagellar motor switch protein FliN/FliY
MTEAASKELTPELTAWFDTWKAALQQTLSQISGQATSFEISPEPLPATESDLWYLVTAGGVARGEMTFRLPSTIGVRLAQMFMGETEPASNDLTAEHKEALEELMRQVAGLAATALGASLGEVQLHVAASPAPSWPAATAVCLRSPSDAAAPVSLEIQISAALLTALQTRPQEQPPLSSSSPLPSPPLSSSGPPPPASYERLMDVGLEVKLRFGSRRMVLRDVLALSAGVVVELDRNLQAPVDLLLDGRIIAQGEVVVVDGKYGLRITEVLDPGSAA